MGGPKEIISTLAILQSEEIATVLLPPVRLLVRLAGQESWEVNFLESGLVHFITNNVLNIAVDDVTQREPRVDTCGNPAHISGSNEQFMAGDLSVGWVFSQSA